MGETRYSPTILDAREARGHCFAQEKMVLPKGEMARHHLRYYCCVAVVVEVDGEGGLLP